MSEIPFIKLHYGPYIVNGIIRHKVQRLYGIKQCLTKLGYAIEIVPSIHLNRLTVEMLGREIYRCNIENLQFNIECKDDVTCKRLVESVQEATQRLYVYDNFPKHHPISKGKKIIQEIKSKKTAQDLFSSDINLWFEIPKNCTADFMNNLGTTEEEEEEKLCEANDNVNTLSIDSDHMSMNADDSIDPRIF